MCGAAARNFRAIAGVVVERVRHLRAKPGADWFAETESLEQARACRTRTAGRTRRGSSAGLR
jgi:hypothetical protein